jgi:hypothetical protein
VIEDQSCGDEPKVSRWVGLTRRFTRFSESTQTWQSSIPKLHSPPDVQTSFPRSLTRRSFDTSLPSPGKSLRQPVCHVPRRLFSGVDYSQKTLRREYAVIRTLSLRSAPLLEHGLREINSSRALRQLCHGASIKKPLFSMPDSSPARPFDAALS